MSPQNELNLASLKEIAGAEHLFNVLRQDNACMYEMVWDKLEIETRYNYLRMYRAALEHVSGYNNNYGKR